MMFIKDHDHNYFYKYTSSHIGKLILNNLQIRWNSPIVFNDPFDAQFDLNFGFELDDFVDAFYTEIESLIDNVDEPKCNINHPIYLIVHMLRRSGKSTPRDELKREMHEGLKEGIENIKRSLEQEHNDWQQFIHNARVFCVSEKHDDILMWSHYSDSHRGIVIKFKCLPEQDTALCAAKPITYRPDIPRIATLDEWVKHSSGQIELDFSKVFYNLAFTKSDHWTYEKEWRCFTLRKKNDGNLFDMGRVLPEEIDTIYLGCNIEEAEKNEILDIIKGGLSHVNVFQAHTSSDSFSLLFEKLK